GRVPARPPERVPDDAAARSRAVGRRRRVVGGLAHDFPGYNTARVGGGRERAGEWSSGAASGLAARQAARLRPVLPRQRAVGDRDVVPEPRLRTADLPVDPLGAAARRPELLAVHPDPGADALGRQPRRPARPAEAATRLPEPRGPALGRARG